MKNKKINQVSAYNFQILKITTFIILLFLCFGCMFITFAITDFRISKQRNNSLGYLEHRDWSHQRRISQIEDTINNPPQPEPEEVETNPEEEIESYKDKLRSINRDIEASDKNKIPDHEMYKVEILVDRISNRSFFYVISLQDNSIFAEKIIDGLLIGDYGQIYDYSVIYNKIFFSVGPYYGYCEYSYDQEGLDACKQNQVEIAQLYETVGGIWYFDIQTKEFIQMAKQSDIYNPGSPPYNY